MRATRALIVAVLGAGALTAVVVAAVATGGGDDHPRSAGSSMMSMTPPSTSPSGVVGGVHAAPGTTQHFAYLAAQHTNACSLQPAMVMRDADTMRLQGSCCSAMDAVHYRAQVSALRAYRADALVPADPYDISAAVAKRLLGYERTITLSHAQQVTYAKGMSLSAERGPCCCHCWRWDVFAGLSKYLIASRHISPTALGALIEDLDGCGGPAEA